MPVKTAEIVRKDLCSAGVVVVVFNQSALLPVSSSGRQALSDVTPRILYQQALNDTTSSSSYTSVSAVASDISVGSTSSVSHGRVV